MHNDICYAQSIEYRAYPIPSMSCQVIGMVCCYVANLMATCTCFFCGSGNHTKMSHNMFVLPCFFTRWLFPQLSLLVQKFRSPIPIRSDRASFNLVATCCNHPSYAWEKERDSPILDALFVFFGVVNKKATHEAFPSSNHKIYHLSHNRFCSVISPDIIVYHLISPYIPIVGCLKSLSTLSTTLLKTPQGHKDICGG